MIKNKEVEMIVTLAECLGSLDSSLSVVVNKSGNIYTIGVRSDELGDMYSFSSPSVYECFDRTRKYLECLTNIEKFDELIKEIENDELLGV